MSKHRTILVIAAAFAGVWACGLSGASPECKAYVECYEKLGSSSQSLLETYGDMGTCWKNMPTAEACTDVCRQGVDRLKMMYPDAGC